MAEPPPGGDRGPRQGAPPVLLLHGQPGTVHDWDALLRVLGTATEPIVVARPGWGAGGRATDLHGNALAATAALDARGVGRAVVVGHSFGAAVAAWLAAAAPERITALVLVAPAANAAALYRLDRCLAAPGIAELTSAVALAGLGAALLTPAARRRVGAAFGLDQAYLRAAGPALLHPAAWVAQAAEQRALVRDLPALERRLGQIRAPTTILTGAEDRIVPGRAARALAAQIPDAQLRVVQRAGHLLPQAHPEAVAAAVLAARACP